MTNGTLGQHGLIYLASPYSRYPTGTEQAFRDVAAIAGRLVKAGYYVYSPIVFTHALAAHSDLSPLDQRFWLAYDETMMAKADTLFVCTMDGWQDSYGIAHEVAFFRDAGKPIFKVNPTDLGLDPF